MHETVRNGQVQYGKLENSWPASPARRIHMASIVPDSQVASSKRLQPTRIFDSLSVRRPRPLSAATRRPASAMHQLTLAAGDAPRLALEPRYFGGARAAHIQPVGSMLTSYWAWLCTLGSSNVHVDLTQYIYLTAHPHLPTVHSRLSRSISYFWFRLHPPGLCSLAFIVSFIKWPAPKKTPKPSPLRERSPTPPGAKTTKK